MTRSRRLWKSIFLKSCGFRVLPNFIGEHALGLAAMFGLDGLMRWRLIV